MQPVADRPLLNSPENLVSPPRTHRDQKIDARYLSRGKDNRDGHFIPLSVTTLRCVILIVTQFVLMDAFIPQGLNASWMRWLRSIPEVALRMVLVNSPSGIPCGN